MKKISFTGLLMASLLMLSWPSTGLAGFFGANVCTAEVARVKAIAQNFPGASADVEREILARREYTDDCRNLEFLKRMLTQGEDSLAALKAGKPAHPVSIPMGEMSLCFDRASINRCTGSPPTAARPTDSTTASPSRPVANANPSSATDTANSIAPQQSAAVSLANKRQADVDRARLGKPKRHVVAREAHNCLKPQTGGGVINNCPYAVEYNYCVLRPEPNSWSELFACGKHTGSWQIGPGPNTRSIMHTAGQATYWFACRSGDTLGKPDGVSPVDIEYQAGRGLLGRCAEWGSGGK